MYNRGKIIIAMAVLCSFAISWGAENVNLRIASFKLSGPALMESEIVSVLGSGYVKQDRVGNSLVDKYHIYYIASRKVWLSIRLSHVVGNKFDASVDEIFVTKSKLCDKKYRPKKDIEPLIKPIGIHFGASIDEIINILGKPTLSVDIGKNESYAGLIAEKMKYTSGHVIRYLPDSASENIVQEFYFNGRGLHSLLISVAE